MIPLLLLTVINFTVGWRAPKHVIHLQVFSDSGSISSVVANSTYIDTLPFDGIVVKFPDYQDVLGPSYVANYTTLNNQISPIEGVLTKVRHNYAHVITGASGMVDPFDDWTQTIANFVILAQVCRDTGLEGIFLDNEEYGVHWWQYPDDVVYAGTKTVSEYQEQWRLRGTQVMQAIIAEWPQAKIVVLIGPNRSVTAVPAGAMFQGDPNWLGGYFFMGLFAAAPGGNHVISGGELYYNRTVTQFSNWKTFFETTLTQSPQSPPLMPSSLYSTWTDNASLSFGIYDQDTVGTPVMSYSVLEQTIVNAMPYVDEFVWNYSESLDWLTPGAGSEGNWQNAVWSARSQLGLPPP